MWRNKKYMGWGTYEGVIYVTAVLLIYLLGVDKIPGAIFGINIYSCISI